MAERGPTAGSDAAFLGSVPANYDCHLGPLLFQPYAEDLAERLPVRPGLRVLETACGTGIVTEQLVARLGGAGALVATDLNEPMIAQARQRLPASAAVEWKPADATSLPFPDASFDAVVCQFGLMFFPDKALGVREAFRVLRPGGLYLFNVWDTMDRSPAVRIAHETAAALFPQDPPRFYLVPFSLADTDVVGRLLREAGFADVQHARVEKTGISPSAVEAARGLIQGNPIGAAIVERKPGALPEVEAAVARQLTAELGDRPVRNPMRAIVWTARRP